MIGIEKVETARKAAKAIAINAGKTVHEWDGEVTSGQHSLYSFMNAEEKNILRITPGEPSVFFGRVVSHDRNEIEGIMILCDTEDIMELIVTFFVVPEETYESFLNMEGIMRISSSR
ncbi:MULTISPECIES: hypothetical protein [Halorubrum]|uniref:hypothetical protein n=1 Tax=Halorubrum TaxID=56688 RepID=UPI0010F650BF|nr:MULTISPECIES: hypothetical protein [Halorubrum]TKX68247.1 hypothetical protein EXE40_12960 [Halorubrum sp. GN11GM_10-3_MGM]